MKKLLYSLIIMIAAICACQDENSELGKSLVDSSFYNIYVDTCTVDKVFYSAFQSGKGSSCPVVTNTMCWKTMYMVATV